jgi:hypothetical protein
MGKDSSAGAGHRRRCRCRAPRRSHEDISPPDDRAVGRLPGEAKPANLFSAPGSLRLGASHPTSQDNLRWLKEIPRSGNRCRQRECRHGNSSAPAAGSAAGAAGRCSVTPRRAAGRVTSQRRFAEQPRGREFPGAARLCFLHIPGQEGSTHPPTCGYFNLHAPARARLLCSTDNRASRTEARSRASKLMSGVSSDTARAHLTSSRSCASCPWNRLAATTNGMS